MGWILPEQLGVKLAAMAKLFTWKRGDKLEKELSCACLHKETGVNESK